MENPDESPKRPDHWRLLTLVETRRARYRVCFPYTYNPVDKGVLRAAGLAAERKTEGLKLDEAIELGNQIEKWNQENYARADRKGLK